tara:strand:- start:6215 stop:7837 length:1623 start_codon:yes stop_codon:yes gene_type:complete
MSDNKGYQRYFQGLYNVSGFDGTIESDFLKLGAIPDDRKSNLIDYNLKGFDDYRVALQNYLKAVYPLDYNNFAASDLGQMLLEMFAYMASVLTLRADMTANEMYIDTVKDEGNLKRLLQLIGVSMKGPTASKATGQLTIPSDVALGAGSVTVRENNRRINITNQRSGTPLTYTMYQQLSNGALDLFTKDLAISNSDFTDNVNNNIILLEGALQTQTGSFEAAQSRQTITIPNGPIIEGSIGVSSTEGYGVQYNEISNLFAASGGDQPVFEKTYTDGFGAVLTFGDGVLGRLPTPGATYTITYRRGGGVNGDIVRENINQDINVVVGTQTVNANIKNITKGTGGLAAETVEHAKRYAPYFFRTQYRAVTGEDYNALANSFVGNAGQTAKAMAVLRKNGAAANVIDLYVLSKASENQLERASIAFKKELLDYFKNYKMLTDDVVISDGVVRTLDIVATVFIDKSNQRFSDSIKAKAADKLVEYFNVDRVGFGQKLSIADLTNFMLTVPEIRFFNVDNLDKDIFVNFNEIVQLNNFEFTIEFV